MAEELEAIFDLSEGESFDAVFEINAAVYDYETLDKKPQINGETLIGNKTSEELHLASKQDIVDIDADIELVRADLRDLDTKVDGINVNLTQQIEETQQDVNDKYNELIRDIDDLTDVVEEDYNTLDTKINTTSQTINQRITDVADELNQTIEENVVSLQQEDTALQNQINAHSTTLTAYDTRITNNANAITQEITNRQNADDNLQEQIDGITAGSDVKDIVGTYAELQAYDKSTLGDNDIIKVLQDETQENASTYYRYIASTQSFTYIGKEGPFYTKSETDTLLNAKQNTIDDLVTIRDNASDGKVASDTIATYGNIVTHNADEFQVAGDYATNTALTNGLATKQNITDNNLVTTAKTVVGAVNELDAKIKEIELYKTPNVLIQGEPTINNGQVTGFSKTNYLILPFEFNVGERGVELTYAFRTGNDVTTAQNLFGSKFSIASYIQNGKLTIRISSNGTSWDILDLITSLNIQPNTTYYIKLIFNRLGYTIKYSADGAEYSEIGSIVDTRPPFAGDVYIGIGNNQNNPFLGMINLHKWELKYNNSIFWEGMDDAGLATRADISLSNLDEIGQAKFDAKQNKLIAGPNITIDENTNTISATGGLAEVNWGGITGNIENQADLKSALDSKQDIIDDLEQIRDNASTGANLVPQVAVNTQRIEDLTTARIPDVIYHGTPKIVGGQVSNFSTVNYLQFPFEDISRSLPFDIYFGFTTDDDVTTQQNIIDSRFGIALAIQNSKGVMALSSNGTSWDIGSVTGTNTLLPNTTYYVKYSWTGTEYNASLSTNDQSYVPDMILQSNKSPYKTTIYIGGSEGLFGPGTAHPFKGIINFTKSRVDVNGITVWEGMADVGIASRANVSLTNLDEVGEARFSDLQTAIDTKANESDLTAHTDNTTIHVTASDKIAWSQKQNTSDNTLTTTDKTIVGAINELNAKPAGLPTYIEATETLRFGE